MKLCIFDAQTDSHGIWQDVATSFELHLHLIADWERLQDLESADTGLLVLDQSVCTPPFLPQVKEVCNRFPKQRVIVTANRLQVADVAEVMRGGAAYAFEKPLDITLVRRALPATLEVARGLHEVEIEYKMLTNLFGSLTERERSVLNLVLEGVPNKETADQLKVSVRTVESRRAKVYRKLESNNLAEMVRKMERLEQLRLFFSVPRSPREVFAHHPHLRRQHADSTTES